ncbi:MULTISPECIES: hypothetical protein [Oscillospiraceae]|uniref:Uncharacterized protein n=1 Tax=Harryflintia acetispora TaxID=1849041 RepID=A0A9X8UIE2_9FIRM|nr:MULTISPECIES: hypothetical protein [Oscillospiraceae]RGB66738.1 hypothetical protein DW086_08040 [Harryflintia acetispora]TCL42430.1 hypothetical protein EDD78_11056 [Harryflintia acetispora]
MGEKREGRPGDAPHGPPRPDGRPRGRKRKTGTGYSEDMILMATSLATQLARGKTECELETLINILDILSDVLVGILAQRRICDRQGIEILQDGDFII